MGHDWQEFELSFTHIYFANPIYCIHTYVFFTKLT